MSATCKVAIITHSKIREIREIRGPKKQFVVQKVHVYEWLRIALSNAPGK